MTSPTIIRSVPERGIEPLLRRFSDDTGFPSVGGFSPGDPAGAAFTVRSLLRGFTESVYEGIAMREGGGFSNLIVWESLPWDTEVLGLSCARIHFLGGKALPELLAWWKERITALHIRYVTFRVGDVPSAGGAASDGFAETRQPGTAVQPVLEEAGFERIERLVFVQGSTDCPDPPRRVDDARERDVDDIVKIAQSSYSLDRFHNERLFSPEVVGRFHRMRFLGSFRGRADKVLVVRDEHDRPAGYITCMFPRVEGARMGILDMLAVRSDARRRGYARSLLFGALGYFRGRGFGKAGGGVHEGNTATRSMYSGLGFVEFNAVATYKLVL